MSITTLKFIALIFMTIDHLGQFIPDFPVWFHWIGRMSAPIFIFCMVWGYHYTKNKTLYVIRLYLLSNVMSFVNLILNIFIIEEFIQQDIWKTFYVTVENNIFSTLFSICIVISLIEFIKVNHRKGILMFILYLIWQIIGAFFIILHVPEEYFQIVGNICGNACFVEGGLWVIILGVLLYYVKNNKKKLVINLLACSLLFFVNAIFCISSNIVFHLPNVTLNANFNLQDAVILVFQYFIGIPAMSINILDFEYIFYFDYQWMMLFSLPFILAYNGKRGKKVKKFFYIYYPLHIYVLWFAGNIIYNYGIQ